MICMLADYRVQTVDGSTPFESLEDAKSAVRFIRANADKFHVDPDKIVCSGGSAGRHLAAATAAIKKYNDKNDDLRFSCKPNALVLLIQIIDSGTGCYGYDWVGEENLI